MADEKTVETVGQRQPVSDQKVEQEQSKDVDAPVKELHQHGDKALGFLEAREAVVYTREEEMRVLRKIDKVLMPLMLVSYMLQYMDKGVMAQAAVYDIIPSLGLKGQDYSWCSSSFYFGYLLFQPIGSRLLARMPLGRFVIITSLAWAVILFCTAGAYNFAGMMVVRFFLGVAEGGISPAYVLITASWYKKNEIPLRINIWFCGNGCASIVQAFLAYGIGHIDNTGIPVWRWFFIIFGMIGLVWSAVLWRWMPDSPLTAKFLDERERMIAVERLRQNRTGIANSEYKKDQMIEAFRDPKVWYGFFYAVCCVIPANAVANFGGLIIEGLGFGSFETSLLNCPLGVAQNLGLLSTGFAAFYFPNKRCLLQFLVVIPAVLGSTLVYALPEHNKAGRLAGFYLTEFFTACITLQFALMASNIAGHTKRAAANAVFFVGYSIGFIVGPQFFLGSEAPRYPTGFKTMIVTYSIVCLSPLGFWCYLTYLNRQKARKLESLGQADVYLENEEFLDLTDRQQLHFVYIK